MTDHQKLEFLSEWCGRLSRAIKEQRATSQTFHDRLLRVEAKVAGTS
jgi:hypothetical protein